MDRLVRIGTKVLKKIIDKRVSKLDDEKSKIVVTAIVEMAIMTISIFLDKDKDNKAQLNALLPKIQDKSLDVAEELLDL